MRSATQQSILIDLQVNTRQVTDSIRQMQADIQNAVSVGSKGLMNSFAGNLMASGVMTGLSAMKDGYDALTSSIAEAASIQTKMIGSAGSLSAITGMSFKEATGFTKQLNGELAELAATLPGVTQDYVSTANTLATPVAKALKLGNNGILDESQLNSQLKELTKNLTVASVGIGGSAEDTSLFAQRALGTGSLAELRQLNLGEKSPIVTFMEEILKERGLTDLKGLDAAQRLDVLSEASTRITPQEQIDALSNSVEGMIEGVRSSILDPNVGLFGMLRPLAELDGSTFMDSVQGFLKNVLSLGGAFASLVNIDFDPMVAMSQFLNKLSDMAKTLQSQLGGNLDFSNIFADLGNLLAKGMKIFGDKWISVISNIDWLMVGNAIGKSLVGISVMVRNFILSPELWANGVRGIVAGLKAVIEITIGILKGVFSSSFKDMAKQAQTIIEGLINIIKKAVGSVETSFSNLISIIKNVLTSVGSKFQSLVSSFQNIVSRVRSFSPVQNNTETSYQNNTSDNASSNNTENSTSTSVSVDKNEKTSGDMVANATPLPTINNPINNTTDNKTVNIESVNITANNPDEAYSQLISKLNNDYQVFTDQAYLT